MHSVKGLETSVTKSLHVAPRYNLRCGDHVENHQGFVKRWVPNEAREREVPIADHQARSPSLHHEMQEVRLEPPPYYDRHLEAKHE